MIKSGTEDPRLGEIEARLAAIATPQPWEAKPYRSGFGGDPNRYPDFWDIGDNVIYEKEDAEFIAHSPADVAYLLAELRNAREALARVEGLCARTEKGRPQETDCPEDWMLDPEDVRDVIRAAVDAADGSGE